MPLTLTRRVASTQSSLVTLPFAAVRAAIVHSSYELGGGVSSLMGWSSNRQPWQSTTLLLWDAAGITTVSWSQSPRGR
jgi:hypothetical protein